MPISDILHLKQSPFNQTTRRIAFDSGGTSAPVFVPLVRMGEPTGLQTIVRGKIVFAL